MASVATNTEAALRIERTEWGAWGEAWRVTRGNLEMTVLSGAGPRIISFGAVGGENLLYVDEAGAIAREAWKFYGGSRFWVSPETESSYFPENAPCEARATEDELTVTMPREPSGLRRAMRVRAATGHDGFAVTYSLLNEGEMLARGGIWVLTCARGPGRLICPWNEGTEGWSTQMIRFWRKWSRFGSDVASPQWKLDNELLTIEPTGEVGKVGLYSDHGLLALARADGTFIKHARPRHGMQYPDGGCNLEICTTPHFIEMETLSPEVQMLPGEGIEHEEAWLWTEARYEPAAWREIKQLVAPEPAGARRLI